MPSYLLSPRAPLLFRDGRPAGNANQWAETLVFPLPSTVAGALRALYGEQQQVDYVKAHRDLLNIAIAGPLLVQLGVIKKQGTVLLPRPADAIYFQDGKNEIRTYRLQPVELTKEKEGVDLPLGLMPILPNDCHSPRPASGPAFWFLDKLTEWLANDGAAGFPIEHLGLITVLWNIVPMSVSTLLLLPTGTGCCFTVQVWTLAHNANPDLMAGMTMTSVY